MRIVWLLVLGCTQQADDRSAATPERVVIAPEPAVAVTRDAAIDAAVAAVPVKSAPGAPDGKVLALKELQQSLGSEAETCTGTAKIIASQGTTSPAKRAWRERTVARLCKDDRWPATLRSCVATADHDQLSCTSHLETKRQRDHWNTAMESWFPAEP
ncbi:MAG: hypothetical protein H0T89_28800 [Deltaproteobacteria bacterium]|nr:hypothetical protein [Deltaproteobacteria bacterium]MDQ3295866.1 hypothetical protein [Myxococcota bacterium]